MTEQDRLASHSRPVGAHARLIILALFGLLVGWALTSEFGTAKSYNTCEHPSGYCGSHYYSSIGWTNSTGWGGSFATAISNSGSTWNSAGYVGVGQSANCPCNAIVYAANLGTYAYPAITYVYFNSGDPYEIIYSEIYLNTLYSWYVDGTLDPVTHKADVRTVTTHEMGHMVGLNHDCTYSAAVMCATWTQKWGLAADDLNGLNALY